MAAPITGEEFFAVTEEKTRTGISADLARQLLTPEQIASISTTTSYVEVSCKRLDSSKKPEFTIPNLSNATPKGLTDMLGQTREEISQLKKLEKVYKEALLVYFGEQVNENVEE